MQNPVGQLVAIKNLREEKADRAVRAQRRVLEDAVAQREAAGRRLDDYKDYAAEQERRMYQALCERPVLLRDIEDVQGQVLSLRWREADHQEALDTAESRRAKEEQQLQDDRVAHSQALRMRDKFIELHGIFADEIRADAERAEEAQIEEAAETRRPAAQQEAGS